MPIGNGKRNRGRVPYRNGKSTPAQPSDERNGDHSREHLLKMDARFRDRVERAFRLGLESQLRRATSPPVRARDLQQAGAAADCISRPTPVESSDRNA